LEFRRVLFRSLGASVLLFEQRERERRAVRARLDVERRLQGEIGRGGPLAARGARLPGVEREVQQLLGLQADVVRGLRVRAPIEAGRHLLAGSDLPAAVRDEARGPAQAGGGDRVLPVGAHELARLPGHLPVDPAGPWSSMVTSRPTPSCWASSAKAAPPTPSRSSPPTAPTVARRRETAVLRIILLSIHGPRPCLPAAVPRRRGRPAQRPCAQL